MAVSPQCLAAGSVGGFPFYAGSAVVFRNLGGQYQPLGDLDDAEGTNTPSLIVDGGVVFNGLPFDRSSEPVGYVGLYAPDEP